MEGTVGIARASTITYQTHRSNRKLPKKFYFATCKGTDGTWVVGTVGLCRDTIFILGQS